MRATDLLAPAGTLEGARRAERPNHRARLVDRFLVLGAGIGVGDYAAAGLDIDAAVLDQDGAQRDGGVRIAGVTEVADRAGVDPAAHRFEFVDYFHRADFRRARHRA